MNTGNGMRPCRRGSPRPGASSPTSAGAVRRAFTLLELMVVAAIFVLLLALAVPAFSNMLYSSEQSMAGNSLRGGISAARDAAARGARGDDAVAAFFYDPATGYTIVPYVRVGVLHDDPPPGGPRPPLEDSIREVFVPAPGYEPVQLPRGWSARGFAAPNTIDDAWYGDNTAYADSTVRRRGQWLFPETAFYLQNNSPVSPATANAGDKRQTFIIRFEGGTGQVKPFSPRAVLLLAPAPTTSFRTGNPFGTAAFRADRESNGMRFVRRVLAAPGLNDARKRQLLGDVSTDTVLAKQVSSLALYNERALANYLGASIDRGTRSMYLRFDRPEFVPPNQSADQFLRRLSEWIENRTEEGESDASIFTIHRYLGNLEEVSGTIWRRQ